MPAQYEEPTRYVGTAWGLCSGQASDVSLGHPRPLLASLQISAIYHAL
jgi:hypothetical protein